LARKDSWLPDPIDAEPYGISGAVNLPKWMPSNPFIADSARFDPYPPAGGNASLSWELDSTLPITRDNSPDTTLASIFTTSLQATDGSAATALSTIITVLASMEYYDQFPNFAETARDVSTTYFQPFLFPQSFRGLAVVLAVTLIQCLLVSLVVATFLTSTTLSALGEHWQSIAQVVSPSTESALAKAGCATDKEVRAYLKAQHREHEMAKLQVLAEDGGRVGLVARKPHRRSSHDMSLE
jgi:hypothetical protein